MSKMIKFLFVLLVLIKLVVCASVVYDDDGFWVTNPQNSLFPSLPIVSLTSEDDMCKRDSKIFLSAFRNKTLWAMQMWDSSAKAATGVLSGSIFQLGNYDECLKTKGPFEVQFCVAQVSVDLPTLSANKDLKNESGVWAFLAKLQNDFSKVPRNTLNWGMCVPITCKHKEMEKAINSYLASHNSNSSDKVSYRASLKEEYCSNEPKSKKFSLSEICFWMVLAMLVLVTVISTLIDLTPLGHKHKNSKKWKSCMIFSIKQNLHHLFPKKRKATNSLNVFHGIKVISILPIVFGHRIGISLTMSATNFDDVEGYLIENHKMFIIQSDLVVDTFFFISGLLACFYMMSIFTKHFINPIFAIFVRVARLAPLYYFLIWFQSSAAFRLGSGPLWKAFARNETQFCIDNWWTNVLFINNYVKTNEMCMPHSWFIPCELHFFTLATILVTFLVKHPRVGKILLFVCLIVAAAVPAVVIYATKVHPLMLFYYEFLSHPRESKSFNVLYIKSHNRAAVYLIGLAVGYYLHHKQHCEKQLSKKTALAGCFAWLAFMFAPMAYGSLYYDSKKNYNLIEAAIFGSLRRIIWAIGFAVFTLSHRFGKIPFIDVLCSSRIVIFLSKITYGIYLLHYGFIITDVMSARTAKPFSIHDTVIKGTGDILKSGVATVIMCLIFEIPLKRLLKELIFAKQANKVLKTMDNENNNAMELQNSSPQRL